MACHRKNAGALLIGVLSFFSACEPSPRRTATSNLELVKEIPREANLSLSDFWELYADTQTPVIITDYAHLFSRMTAGTIRDACGSKNVSVARRVARETAWAGIEEQEEISLDSAFEMRTMLLDGEGRPSGSDTNHGMSIGVFDWSLVQNCPELLDEAFIMPRYFAQVITRHNDQNIPKRMTRPVLRGPCGSPRRA